jgi:RNA polymerase sigma-70 factor (ECF subfamily)
MPQEQEFIQLLNKHQNIIHKVTHLYTNNTIDREDLFQEICLQAWKSINSFRGESQFSTWLYRVALNIAITHLKKEKNKPTPISLLPNETELENNNPIELQTQAMHKAIAELNKIDKALVMLYLEDYSYIDIGKILGITPNNVAVKMNRLKVKLKERTEAIFNSLNA